MSQGIESNSTNAVASPSMQEEEIQVNSVSEFIEKIVQLDKEEGTEIFYRGHADKDWVLLPSIFRTPNGVEKEHLLFRDMVAHEPQSFSECKSALDYLVQMQHYGLPTRLLDMTTNPLVALYFACLEVSIIDNGTTSVGSGVQRGAKAGAEAGLKAGVRVLKSMGEELTGKAGDNDNVRLAIRAGAVAGAIACVGLGSRTFDMAVALSTSIFGKEPSVKHLVGAEATAMLGAKAGAKAGARNRGRDGVVYLFSVLENKVKHYDSDTVSVLTNLAKCKISEQCSASTPSMEDFNKQLDIARLCEQVKVEKPHFLPSIQPDTLSSLIFVKPKNGNQRIANQMGAFLLFGLGVKQVKVGDDTGETSLLTKSKHMEVPVEWIKKKLIIPKDKKPDILKELALLGITESYIYPGMEQYAKELKKRYKL